MKTIVIAGGTGFLGGLLTKFYTQQNYNVVVLSRKHHLDYDNVHFCKWDGKSTGPWVSWLEGAEVVVNLTGKSVDCRYNKVNKSLIYDSRLDSTHALGKAILNCRRPPKLWINAASATIYKHTFDQQMDEESGTLGDGFSVDVCKKWEQAFEEYQIPGTRKILLRTGIVLGPCEGAYKPLRALTKLGFGGRQGSGNQYVSWLHHQDFVSIVEFVVNNTDLEGAYNVTTPNPCTNREMMRSLRKSYSMPFGIPIPVWLLKLGALLIGTETELILKSRRVVPRRLLDAGFVFKHSCITDALIALK